jgi:hypothetical protein
MSQAERDALADAETALLIATERILWGVVTEEVEALLWSANDAIAHIQEAPRG